jgi:hypothetical protein
MKVTAEQLVREWLKGGTQTAIAKRLGVKQPAVSLLAKKLRLSGVKLPSLHSNGRAWKRPLHPGEVAALNALIREAGK